MNDVSLMFGHLVVDRGARAVSYQGRQIALSPREFAILDALVACPGTPVSRRELRERLYGAKEPAILGNPVQVHIHNLRAKLGEEVIHTVRGSGYVVSRMTCVAPSAAVMSIPAPQPKAGTF